MTKFTADQLAGVYVSRWKIRDMTNSFIQYLRPVPLMSTGAKFRRSVPFPGPVKIKQYGPIDTPPKILNPPL